MQQPELGRQLTALRKERGLTQEELAEKSHVSVRTIQRIEACEVLPRMSTVKILLEALGQSYETISPKVTTMEATSAKVPNRNILLIAVFAGAVYLFTEVIIGAMDIAWLTSEDEWAWWTNLIYINLTAVSVLSYILFMRGFLTLSAVFENSLLKVIGYMMIAAVVGVGILDVSSLSATDIESLWIPYSTASVVFGALTIVFGVALMRLQDGMGELSRAAGILEIIIGGTLVTVVMFFIGYIVMVPAVIVEILLLYKGYEYLSRSEAVISGPSV